MAQLPRLIVHVTEAATGKAAPKIDITLEMLRGLQVHEDIRTLVADRSMRIVDLMNLMDAPASGLRKINDGTLVMTDFFEAADAFLEHLPDSYEVRLFSKAFEKIMSLERKLVPERERVIRLKAARWEPNPKVFEFVYEETAFHFREGYSTIDEAMGDKNVPVAFGTVAHSWTLPCTALRRVVADAMEDNDERPNANDLLSEFIENEMSDQYEDAEDDIVDLDGLQSMVEAWLPYAGSGSPEDLALEASLAPWNAKQKITSYMVDFSVIVPLLPGLTRERAIEMAEERVAALRKDIRKIRNTWAPTASPSNAAPSP